ncbi:NPHP3 [Linum perenne]
MAAPVLSSPCFTKNQFGRSCVCAQPSPLWNNITSFSLCTEKNRCSIKFNLIHSEVVPRHWMSKMFASVGSVNADTECEENHVSSRVSSSRDSMRTKPFPGESSNQSDGADNFHVQLKELFDEIKLMIKMGRKRNARDLLQANYELVKEQIGGGAKGIEQAATLDIVALGHLLLGDLKIVGKSSTFLVSPLLGMAKGLASVKSTKKAVEIYHRAIHILESSSGAESEDLIVPLFALGNLLVKEGNATDAETPFLRILSIYSKLYGENDGRVGMAMASVAHAKCASGRENIHIDCKMKAVFLVFMLGHPFYFNTIRGLSRISNRGKEGRELLEECLLITEKSKGKEHPSSVPHLLNLATSYSQSKNYVEAERLLRTSLEIKRRNGNPEDPSITFPMLQLAVTLYQLKRDEEAEQLALDALHIRQKAFGNNSMPAGEAMDCLVCIQSRLGKAESELLEMLQRVLKIQETNFGVGSEKIMPTLKKIVFYLDKLGRKDEKLLMQRRLSALKNKFKQMTLRSCSLSLLSAAAAAGSKMAAPVLSSPCFTKNQFGRSCVCAQPSPLWNNITSFSLCTEKNRCSIKFNLIHSEVVPRHWMSKMFASVGSVNADTECEENHVSSRVSSSRDSMRTKPFPGESSNQSDGADNFHVQLKELFDEIKLMIKMGRKRNARDLLQANYELVKEQIGGGAKGIEQAATLDIVALGHLLLGDLKIVGQILNTLQEIVDSLNDGTPILDTVLTHMGSMYSALGKYNKSTLVYQRGIRLLEKKYGKSSTFLVSPLLGMAKGLASVKSTKKAVEIYHRAIHILESSSGAESEDLIVPLFALGNLLVKEGNATDAETPFLRILSIYSKLYGENDGRVGMAMASVAHAKCASGKTEEAIDLYKSALQILKCGSHVTIDDGVVEKMKIDLAELLHVVGRGKEGRELLEECLLITEKSKGKEHPSSVPHLLNLATSYSQSKNYVEAERLLRTSLEIKRRNGNPEDPSITFPMLQLAVTLYQLKRDEEAEQLALDALHIRQKAFGNNSMPAGEAMDCLVCIQSRLGKAESELLEMLQRVLKIQETNFGVGSEKIMPTLKKIVFYLDKLGRKDEKLLMQRRLSALKNKFKQMVHY